MNNYQNTTIHQLEGFLKTPLALLGVDLKKSQVNKIYHLLWGVNHPYIMQRSL